jgi:hypothetical protein
MKNAALLKQLRPDNRTVTHRTVTIEIFTLRFNLFQLELKKKKTPELCLTDCKLPLSKVPVGLLMMASNVFLFSY